MKKNLDVERLRSLLSYDEETGAFAWRNSPNGMVKSGATAGGVTNNGYLRIKIDRVLVMAHRLAWLYVNGKMPTGQIDHINCNKLDNRIANLREATPRMNTENQRVGRRRKNGGSLLGASWAAPSKKWRATICHNGKIKHIGLFETEREAHKAYVDVKRKLHTGCTI